MKYDVVDVVSGAFGSIVGRVVLFVCAFWLGCMVGALSLIVGMIVKAGTWRLGDVYQWLWASPVLIFSQWGFLNVPFLLGAFVYFVWSENAGYRAWGVILGVESLMVMLGWCKEPLTGWLPQASAWFTWVVLLTMMETGVWLLHQHQVNTWARELGMVHAAIAQRRAAQEARENALIQREKSGGS